jgi:hypothetical protein
MLLISIKILILTADVAVLVLTWLKLLKIGIFLILFTNKIVDFRQYWLNRWLSFLILNW